MKDGIRFKSKVILTGVSALVVFAGQLLAGTPLTCFPFQIGNARSLPWGSTADPTNWNTPKSDYDTKRLADDTMTLLNEATPVIVRMETMRRASLYGRNDPAAASDLLARLKARALNDKGQANPLFLFDYGYLLETYKQASLLQGDRKGVRAGGGESGYGYVLEALSRRQNDPEMEFAAALIASWPRQEKYREHFRKAVAGAAGDQLLAANLNGRLK